MQKTLRNCSRSSRSPRGNYLFEKVERVSYIRTWFDRSADQKCWFPAPKTQFLMTFGQKRSFTVWKRSGLRVQMTFLAFVRDCGTSSKDLDNQITFGCNKIARITSLKHELLFKNDYPLVIISIFSFSYMIYIKSSLRVSHEKSHNCNSGLWWENTIKNFVEETPSQSLFTWFC